MQRALADGRTVAQSVVDAAAAVNRAEPVGSVGVVVGATLAVVPDLSALSGPVLIPGSAPRGRRMRSRALGERVRASAASGVPGDSQAGPAWLTCVQRVSVCVIGSPI